MPCAPLSPTATKMPLAMMSVINVIPLTGLLPTIAMALAATVVNKNAITVTTTKATNDCTKL